MRYQAEQLVPCWRMCTKSNQKQFFLMFHDLTLFVLKFILLDVLKLFTQT